MKSESESLQDALMKDDKETERRPIHSTHEKKSVAIGKLLIDKGCDIKIENNYRRRAIHNACENGHTDFVKLLIENNCDIECEDNYKQRPIHMACLNGHIDIAKLLIENKCDIDCEDYQKQRPIHMACLNGHIDIVKLLIKNKCDINCFDYKKRRPIHMACLNGHIDIVKLLIERKCNIECKDIDEQRPIHMACLNGHIDIVKLLIENKFYINCEDYKEQRPIHMACLNGHIDIVKLLIENKCYINCFDYKKRRSIHMACLNGHINIVKLLIENKSDIDCEDYQEQRPIHMACLNGYIDIVKLLIENKCYINCFDYQKQRPIHLACFNGHIDIAKLLIENKSDIDCFDYQKQRPIHMACFNGHIDIVKLLIENKCDINCFDYQKRRPIHMACFNGHIDIVKLLIESKCNIECEDIYKQRPIHMACLNGHIDIVKLLMENKCYINCEDYKKQRPIHMVCFNGHIDIVKLFMENSCNIECEDYQKQRPIHMACLNGHIDIVKLLLENRCNIECEDYQEQRPIHMACLNGHIDIVKLLIERKCDIECEDNYKQRPIHIAFINRHIDIVKLLIEMNCDIECEDIYKQKPIHIACRNGDIDIVRLLIGRGCDIYCQDAYKFDSIFVACLFGHHKIVDLLRQYGGARLEDDLEVIADKMGLKCGPDCDHGGFCRESFMSSTFQKEEIAEGSYSVVYRLTESATNRQFALKCIPMRNMDDPSILRNIKNFINICMNSLSHENIIRIFSAIELSDVLYIYMEYIEGKSLIEYIKDNETIPRAKIAEQINRGASFLRDRRIVYGKINPENILVDRNGNVKISDFGWSRFSDYNYEDLSQMVDIKQWWNVEENSDRYCTSVQQESAGRILDEKKFLEIKIQEMESQIENCQNENKTIQALNERYEKEIEGLKEQLSRATTVEKYLDERPVPFGYCDKGLLNKYYSDLKNIFDDCNKEAKGSESGNSFNQIIDYFFPCYRHNIRMTVVDKLSKKVSFEDKEKIGMNCLCVTINIINLNMDTINVNFIDELFDYLGDFRQYAQSSAVARRMTETILYCMCNYCDWMNNEDNNQIAWSKNNKICLKECFNNLHSNKIKLSSAIVICFLAPIKEELFASARTYLIDIGKNNLTNSDDKFLGIKKELIQAAIDKGNNMNEILPKIEESKLEYKTRRNNRESSEKIIITGMLSIVTIALPFLVSKKISPILLFPSVCLSSLPLIFYLYQQQDKRYKEGPNIINYKRSNRMISEGTLDQVDPDEEDDLPKIRRTKF